MHQNHGRPDADSVAEVNPYAPSVLLEFESPKIEPNPNVDGVPTSTVCAHTIFNIGISGGLFGIAFISFGMLTSMMFSASSREIGSALPFLLLGGVVAFAVGTVIALLAAIPVVLISGWAVGLRREKKAHWTPRSTRFFGLITGVLSGYACLAVPGILMGELGGISYGFVPAIFAACTVPLLQFRLARKCHDSIVGSG